MVQLMIDSFGGDVRESRRSVAPGAATPPVSPPRPIECYHVNARLSRSVDDISRPRYGKIFSLLKYCVQAVWCRFRYGVTNFYYVPANPSRVPLYRDWLVLACCRPFFKKIVFHFHAGGLGEWHATQARPWERWVSRRLVFRPDLSLVLRPFNREDGVRLESRRTEVVCNGIPDPCPQFERDVRPRRVARAKARMKLLSGEALTAGDLAAAGEDAQVFRVLFVSLCYRQKGLFDAVDAVALANRILAGTSLRITLAVGGAFWVPAEEVEFQERIRQPDLMQGGPLVQYHGFVAGEKKRRLFCESDCLCFPTYMAEGFPLVLAESMAYGLPPITTNWRSIPEILPENYSGVVEPKSPDQIAAKLLEFARRDYDPSLRDYFLTHYTDATFGERIKSVLLSL
jgi:glycosyltransferase involved in cell wall biosynthesis